MGKDAYPAGQEGSSAFLKLYKVTLYSCCPSSPVLLLPFHRIRHSLCQGGLSYLTPSFLHPWSNPVVSQDAHHVADAHGHLVELLKSLSL